MAFAIAMGVLVILVVIAQYQVAKYRDRQTIIYKKYVEETGPRISKEEMRKVLRRKKLGDYVRLEFEDMPSTDAHCDVTRGWDIILRVPEEGMNKGIFFHEMGHAEDSVRRIQKRGRPWLLMVYNHPVVYYLFSAIGLVYYYEKLAWKLSGWLDHQVAKVSLGHYRFNAYWYALDAVMILLIVILLLYLMLG